MKNPLPVEACRTASDTYHGTRMNQKALDFHTHLHEWNEAQTLVSKHTQLLTASRQQETYLPVKKLAHIEYWAGQVNKYYLPYKAGRPKSSSFMKIDVSKYKMKVVKDNEIKRSKSAFYPKRMPLPSSSSQCRPMTSVRRPMFGTDMNSVRNNIVESQMHYSAQRSDLYSPQKHIIKRPFSGELSELEPDEIVVSEVSDFDELDDESESVTIVNLVNGGNVSELEAPSHHEADVMQPQIVARSCSNRMLNVISIDDCKLTCRYRPQIIKENRKLSDDDEKGNSKPKKMTVTMKTDQTKSKHQNDTANGNEADDEEEGSTSTTDEVRRKMNDLIMNDAIVDSNNNTGVNTSHDLSSHETPAADSQDKERSGGSSDSSSTETTKSAKIRFSSEDSKRERTVTEHQTNFSSRGTSKSSYGRVTNLDSKSVTSKPGRRRQSRTSRINQAINGVVQGRKVMNSLERDFDTRTAQFGRTVVETSDGSETFKKIHANLRKKIDQYMDTHCALKTRDYKEKVRRNSVASVHHIST